MTVDRRATHHVHRGVESLPCYCEAKYDHAIGQESPAPAVLAPVDVARFDCAGCSGYCYGGYHMKADDEYGDYVKYADHRAAVEQLAADLAAARAEVARLKSEAAEADRRSFVDSRVAYRGFSYGVGSQWGIDSLRSAIQRNGDA